jgi:hypothetical protein
VNSGRLEYRCDGTNQPFFDYVGVLGSKRSQSTVTLGVVYFGPKR